MWNSVAGQAYFRSEGKMTAKKWQWFKDYYLKSVLAASAAAAVVIYMLVRFLQPAKEPAITVAVFDTEISEDSQAQWEEDIRQALGLSPGEEVLIRTGYVSQDANDLTGISVLASSGDVDVIIAGRSTFAEMAGYGYFKDLSLFLPDEDYRAMQSVVEEFDYVSQAVGDAAAEQGELQEGRYPFGLSLAGSREWGHLTDQIPSDNGDSFGSDAEMVMGVVLESENADHVIRFLRMMTE